MGNSRKKESNRKFGSFWVPLERNRALKISSDSVVRVRKTRAKTEIPCIVKWNLKRKIPNYVS